MARKQNGGFNKFLNMIGIVDVDREQDDRADEYSSENYGRSSAYVPSSSRRQSQSSSSNRRSSSSSSNRSISSQGGRSNYGNSRRSSYDDVNSRYASSSSSSRRSSRFEDDYTPPASSRSRFEEEPVREAMVPEPRPRRAQPSNRTVMYSLSNLKDANQVITALVNGDTIVMTLDTDDPHLTERIVDTLSGAVFALNATIRKASSNTYLLAPRAVNVRTAYDVDDQF